jgi:hypothetical protein
METIVGLYGKGNEIISWCLLYVGLCLVLSSNFVACIVVVEAHYIKFVQVGLTMTTFVEV